MNKEERKYVAKRIADEANLASSQVKTETPDPGVAFRGQFNNLSRAEASELFELNLPMTAREVKATVSREVVSDTTTKYDRDLGEYITKHQGGTLRFTITGTTLLPGMDPLKVFEVARALDNKRVSKLKYDISELKVNATDQVLLGSAPEALAALGEFKAAVAELIAA